MNKLTEHFSLEEFVSSDYATRNNIDNTPTLEITENLVGLCVNVLEPIRGETGILIILSGYRCPILNKAIGGAENSQHMALNKEAAADIRSPQMTTEQLFQFILHLNVPYSQLICEFADSPNGGWVHVSWDETGRHEALRATKENGKTVYSKVDLPTV